MSVGAWAMLGIAAAGVIAIYAVAAPDYSMFAQESKHDRDLRECVDRWSVSRYAEPEVQAYYSGFVAACMRGRGY